MRRKRIDVIVESLFLRTLTESLDRAGVSGYSVLPVLEGKGALNAWNSDGQVSNAASMVAVLCIVDPARTDHVMDVVFTAIKDRAGFLTVSDHIRNQAGKVLAGACARRRSRGTEYGDALMVEFREISGLSVLVVSFDTFLIDQFGVLHDGTRRYTWSRRLPRNAQSARKTGDVVVEFRQACRMTT